MVDSMTVSAHEFALAEFDCQVLDGCVVDQIGDRGVFPPDVVKIKRCYWESPTATGAVSTEHGDASVLDRPAPLRPVMAGTQSPSAVLGNRDIIDAEHAFRTLLSPRPERRIHRPSISHADVVRVAKPSSVGGPATRWLGAFVPTRIARRSIRSVCGDVTARRERLIDCNGDG